MANGDQARWNDGERIANGGPLACAHHSPFTRQGFHSAGTRPCAASVGGSTSFHTFFLVKYMRMAKMKRKVMTWKPTRLRCSRCGSAAHIRNAATSLAYCATVWGEPSVYSTRPSVSGGGMAMALPGKYLL